VTGEDAGLSGNDLGTPVGMVHGNCRPLHVGLQATADGGLRSSPRPMQLGLGTKQWSTARIDLLHSGEMLVGKGRAFFHPTPDSGLGWVGWAARGPSASVDPWPVRAARARLSAAASWPA
jgi:hypothetical protein